MTYISIDVETDGPIPGENSMLSLGAVAFGETTLLPIGRLQLNPKRLEGAKQHPETMQWWAHNQKAYNAATKDPGDPSATMHYFYSWVKAFPNPIAVVYPAAFDFMFVYWYLMKFVGVNPFNEGAPSCIDLKTFAMALLGKSYKEASKRHWRKGWVQPKGSHTHLAVDDAEEQGLSFIAMLRSRDDLHRSS